MGKNKFILTKPIIIPKTDPTKISIQKCCERYTLDIPAIIANVAHKYCETHFLKYKHNTVKMANAVIVCPEGNEFQKAILTPSIKCKFSTPKNPAGLGIPLNIIFLNKCVIINVSTPLTANTRAIFLLIKKKPTTNTPNNIPSPKKVEYLKKTSKKLEWNLFNLKWSSALP